MSVQQRMTFTFTAQGRAIPQYNNTMNDQAASNGVPLRSILATKQQHHPPIDSVLRPHPLARPPVATQTQNH
jgi:hypothetical protein